MNISNIESNTLEKYTDFVGIPDVEIFNKTTNDIDKEVLEAGISPLDKAILDIQMNAIFGHASDDSPLFKTAFGAIANIIKIIKPEGISLKNGKKVSLGNISHSSGTMTPTSYTMPSIK